MDYVDPIEHRGYAAVFARRFCRRFPHLTHSDLQDACQEAFLAIMSAAVSWDNTRDWLPYAATSIRRALLRWVRGTGVVPLPEKHPGLPAGSVEWDEATPAPAEFSEVRDAINALPQELRMVILGIHFHGETTNSIAETFGVSRKTIFRRERAAFALLRESLL